MRSVLRLTRRNLASNKLRFGLTTFSVLLGVSFVVSSFVLTDGLLAAVVLVGLAVVPVSED